MDDNAILRMYKRDLQIVNDCANLIENTTNPDVFFERWNLYMEKLKILADAQDKGLVKVSGESISKKYKNCLVKKHIQMLLISLLRDTGMIHARKPKI